MIDTFKVSLKPNYTGNVDFKINTISVDLAM